MLRYGPRKDSESFHYTYNLTIDFFFRSSWCSECAGSVRTLSREFNCIPKLALIWPGGFRSRLVTFVPASTYLPVIKRSDTMLCSKPLPSAASLSHDLIPSRHHHHLAICVIYDRHGNLSTATAHSLVYLKSKWTEVQRIIYE